MEAEIILEAKDIPADLLEYFEPIELNKGTVWDIPTQPNPEAHFATFPPALVEPMIKAGCPERGIVLDIFSGAGTSCAVAKSLNRIFIGIEANPDYVKMSEKKIAKTYYQHELMFETT